MLILPFPLSGTTPVYSRCLGQWRKWGDGRGGVHFRFPFGQSFDASSSSSSSSKAEEASENPSPSSMISERQDIYVLISRCIFWLSFA